MRHATKAATIWVQNDFCARVKGSSDEAPVTYEDPQTKEKITHGTADGRKACLHHVASVGVPRVAPEVLAGRQAVAVCDICRGQQQQQRLTGEMPQKE